MGVADYRKQLEDLGLQTARLRETLESIRDAESLDEARQAASKALADLEVPSAAPESASEGLIVFRRHKGSYEESMASAVRLEPTRAALHKCLAGFMSPVAPQGIQVSPYGGLDPRNGWDTHIVKVRGETIGFLSSALTG